MADGAELIMSEEIQEQIDEINMKLERIAEILLSIRNTWIELIPEPGNGDSNTD